MKILVSYRGIPQSPGWATGDMVVKAFRELGHEVVPYAKNYKEEDWVEYGLHPTVYMEGSKPYDLVLFMECNDDDRQYMELKDVPRARKRACWLFDTSYYPDHCAYMVRWFGPDHVFLANPLTIERYRQLGFENTTYLPYACDEELHSRPPTREKTRDVVLVGSIRDDRIALRDELAGHGIDLRLVGGVFREEYVDALASAKIVVNQNPDAGRGLLNMRFFEAQAAGSHVFTEQSDYDVNTWSDGWQHHPATAHWYSDTEDLATKCKDLLTRPSMIVPEIPDWYQSTLLYSDNFLHFQSYRNRCERILKTLFPHEV